LFVAAAITGTLRKVKVEKIPIHVTTVAAAGQCGENCKPTADSDVVVTDGQQAESAGDGKTEPHAEASERLHSEPALAADNLSDLGRLDINAINSRRSDVSSGLSNTVDGVDSLLPLMSIENDRKISTCPTGVSSVARQRRVAKSDDCPVVAPGADKVPAGNKNATNQPRVRAVAVPPAHVKDDQGCKTQ
jgi:hypothetical protein